MVRAKLLSGLAGIEEMACTCLIGR